MYELTYCVIFAAGGSAMQYTPADASKLMNFTPILNGVELQSSKTGVLRNGFPLKSNFSATVNIFLI